MKPKVLLVGHFPPSAGGITSLLLSILHSPITRHYEIIPFNIGRPAKRNVTNNFGYQALINSGFRRAVKAVAITLWHIFVFPIVLLWHRPALIHFHTAPFLVFWETAYYVLISRFLGVPCALQMHFSFRYFCEKSETWLRCAIFWIIRRVSVFVVICKEDVAFVAQEAGRPVRCTYLTNFIDIQNFQASVVRARKQVEKKDDVIVFFLGGSDSERKGFLDLVRAIRLLSNPQSCLRFLLAAVPKEKVEFELQGDHLSLCDVQNWISGDAKIQAFAKTDIFVLPSHAEGMPIAILEAMASGIPVIATRVGGIPDMITDGEEGRLTNPGDFRALAQAISDLAQAPERRKKMGESAFKKASTLYDIQAGTQQLQDLYETILKPSFPLPKTIKASNLASHP